MVFNIICFRNETFLPVKYRQNVIPADTKLHAAFQIAIKSIFYAVLHDVGKICSNKTERV